MSGSSGCDVTAYSEYKFVVNNGRYEVEHYAYYDRWYTVSCRSNPTVTKPFFCTGMGQFRTTTSHSNINTEDLKDVLPCGAVSKSVFNIVVLIDNIYV